MPRERKGKTHQAQQLLKQWDKIVQNSGVLYCSSSDNHGIKHLQLILPASLRDELLKGVHNQCGHQGAEWTEQLVCECCWWPGLHDYIKKYLSECNRCLVAKGAYLPVNTLVTSIIASKPLEVLAMGFMHLGPASDGRENVLVLTDVFTKFTVAVPTRRDQGASTIVKTLVRDWFLACGVPRQIHSDQGWFEAELVQELYPTYGIKKSCSSPYHPQGNGQCEHFKCMLHDFYAISHLRGRRSDLSTWRNCVTYIIQLLMPQQDALHTIYYLVLTPSYQWISCC